MVVDFYHLASTPLERALPSICEKVLASGERLLVVAEADLLRQIDDHLWTYSRQSFLPHGRERLEAQPVALATQPVALNGAVNIAIADGKWREEALSFARAFYFFDDSGLDSARSTWRRLRDKAGVESRYWKQDVRGKWIQGP